MNSPHPPGIYLHILYIICETWIHDVIIGGLVEQYSKCSGLWKDIVIFVMLLPACLPASLTQWVISTLKCMNYLLLPLPAWTFSQLYVIFSFPFLFSFVYVFAALKLPMKVIKSGWFPLHVVGLVAEIVGGGGLSTIAPVQTARILIQRLKMPPMYARWVPGHRALGWGASWFVTPRRCHLEFKFEVVLNICIRLSLKMRMKNDKEN